MAVAGRMPIATGRTSAARAIRSTYCTDGILLLVTILALLDTVVFLAQDTGYDLDNALEEAPLFRLGTAIWTEEFSAAIGVRETLGVPTTNVAAPAAVAILGTLRTIPRLLLSLLGSEDSPLEVCLSLGRALLAETTDTKLNSCLQESFLHRVNDVAAPQTHPLGLFESDEFAGRGLKDSGQFADISGCAGDLLAGHMHFDWNAAWWEGVFGSYSARLR